MIGCRVLVRFLEITVGFSLGILQLEGMKEDISPTVMMIMNSSVTSMLVTLMFRLEIAIIGKQGFSKILDMVITSFAAWVYTVGGSMNYRNFSQYMDFYKGCASFLLALLLLIDSVITWQSIAQSARQIGGARKFNIIVARKNVRVLKRRQSLEKKRNPSRWPSKNVMVLPWRLKYKDTQQERSKIKNFLQRENVKLKLNEKGNELSPQQKLLWAIEMMEAKDREEQKTIKQQRKRAYVHLDIPDSMKGNKSNRQKNEPQANLQTFGNESLSNSQKKSEYSILSKQVNAPSEDSHKKTSKTVSFTPKPTNKSQKKK